MDPRAGFLPARPGPWQRSRKKSPGSRIAWQGCRTARYERRTEPRQVLDLARLTDRRAGRVRSESRRARETTAGDCKPEIIARCAIHRERSANEAHGCGRRDIA